MNSIIRKTMLYKTGVEYGDYTINHVLGCSHGCKYPCYAFMMAKRFGKVSSYEDWITPKIAINALEILDKEIPRLKSKIKSVPLCFTTDPFMCGYPAIGELSMKIIEKLNNADIKCIVLTKGLLPVELSRLSGLNEYGITLISLNEGYRKKVEPCAASYAERLQSLKTIHDAGCKTWVSMEPYPTPNLVEQPLAELLDSIKFVDRLVFGRANYNSEISAYKDHHSFYNQQAHYVMWNFAKSIKSLATSKLALLRRGNNCGVKLNRNAAKDCSGGQKRSGANFRKAVQPLPPWIANQRVHYSGKG